MLCCIVYYSLIFLMEGLSPTSKNQSGLIVIVAVIVILVIAGGVYAFTRSSSQDLGRQEDQMSNVVGGINSIDTATTPPVTPPTTTIDDGMTTPTTTPAAAAEKSFTVNGNNFSFSPSTLTVKKGDKVKITFNNDKGMHDLVIDEFNARTPIIGAGKSADIEFVADKTGSFAYYCSVGNHRAMGMKGTLIVE